MKKDNGIPSTIHELAEYLVWPWSAFCAFCVAGTTAESLLTPRPRGHWFDCPANTVGWLLTWLAAAAPLMLVAHLTRPRE